MVAGRRHRRPRRRKRDRQAAAGTHISSLPDDILLQIFLRLPSLATLVRAGCTCRAWRRAVASSPDFRRRFRALHPAPPMLGLFFNTAEWCHHPCVPTFAPVRLRDRDLASAVRGGDFFLTSLHEHPNKNHILDCRGGFVLLWYYADVDDWDSEMFIVYNPLMQATRQHDQQVSCIARGHSFACSTYEYADELKARLVFSKEDPARFRIVILGFGEDDDVRTRVCAMVFSSETGEWSDLPWAFVPKTSDSDDDGGANFVCLEDGTMQANGSLYWLQADERQLVSLDTATMEFSFEELPLSMGDDYTYDAGETKEGNTCIVYSDRSSIGVLMHTRDSDGVERWVLDRLVPMDSELERVMRSDCCENCVQPGDVPTEVFVFAVRDGYAYLSTSAMSDDPRKPCWFMSLCLETMSLEKLFQRTYDCDAHPYIMSWPPCLAGMPMVLRWVLDREVNLDKQLQKVIQGKLDDDSLLIDLVADPTPS
ncbi:hypothetical protein QOZ80_1BG0074080 [Eleusine coracana subsp. coracana]|nr:hypothetical protein QOZ80_1BG0074080 [Eleusine coracana subsp. coracana]